MYTQTASGVKSVKDHKVSELLTRMERLYFHSK